MRGSGATFAVATGLLIGWQVRLARRRRRDWGGLRAYGVAAMVSCGVSLLILLLEVVLLTLYPSPGAGRAFGLLALLAWSFQCRDRWVALRVSPRGA